MHLKNMCFTYKSQILKFKIQQKINKQKQYRIIRLIVKKNYINEKSLIGCLKGKKHLTFSIISL